jgi:hypothetical protein
MLCNCVVFNHPVSLHHPQELTLRDDTALAEDSSRALAVAHGCAEAWARAMAARAITLNDAGYAFEALAVHERSYGYGDAATASAVASTASACRDGGSAVGGAAATASGLLQPLRDHHAASPNVLGTLHARERQLLSVMTLRQACGAAICARAVGSIRDVQGLLID